jgi:uncharacterized Zn finger protein
MFDPISPINKGKTISRYCPKCNRETKHERMQYVHSMGTCMECGCFHSNAEGGESWKN